jgi:hypothetical protein
MRASAAANDFLTPACLTAWLTAAGCVPSTVSPLSLCMEEEEEEEEGEEGGGEQRWEGERGIEENGLDGKELREKERWMKWKFLFQITHIKLFYLYLEKIKEVY